MMPSSNNQRSYSRFIPSEEVGDFKQWKFSAVDGSDLVEPTPEPVAEIPVEVDEAELQAQQAPPRTPAPPSSTRRPGWPRPT